jgi:hypothetical protein
MAVGATFAYFTATTNSTESAIQTGSTTLQLQYISYGEAWMTKDLIPADYTVVEYSFESQNDTTISDEEKKSNGLCKDDFGNSICSVYVFQVKNSANSPQTVSFDVASQENSFGSLNAMAYEINVSDENKESYESKDKSNGISDPIFRKNSEDDTDKAISVYDGKGALLNSDSYSQIYINRAGVSKTLLSIVKTEDGDSQVTKKVPAINVALKQINGENQYGTVDERSERVASDIEIGGGETKTFAIVLYIKNENKDQTETDADKVFTGQLIVKSGDGNTGVSGSIGTLTSDKENFLQSNTMNEG